MNSTLSVLNDDAIRCVFSSLSTRDLLMMRSVSKKTKRNSERVIELEKRAIKTSKLKHIVRLRFVRNLTVNYNHVTEDLKRLTGLQSLTIFYGGIKLTDESISLLTGLHTLEVAGCRFINRCFIIFANWIT